ncbi:pilus assembly protein TadE [Novosphingobium sp. G106]|nr:pilus assembly protein TadE [Novosphingobium sp. G106]
MTSAASASWRSRARRFAGLLAVTSGRLVRDKSANSLIEFAFSMPIFLTLGMYGAELANMAATSMQVSQIAMALADNSARLGQTDNSAVLPTILDPMVNSVMSGAMKQGTTINFQANGRVILSSLEQTAGGLQYIHWQRCKGNFARASAYGPLNYGNTGTAIPGLGKNNVSAPAGQAVMFVEAFYSYKSLFGNMFVKNAVISQEAAFLMRDRRDLARGIANTTDCT